MIYRIVSFLIILSMFSCKHDLERTNPLDPNSPYFIPPSIQILAPNGGEEFEVGTSNTISWTSTKVDKINIELLKNDNIHDVLDSDIENTNSYLWEISSNINIVDTTYKVRITSSNNSEVYDESNSFFTITEDPQPANINITSPTLNDNWSLGSSYDIVWNSTNITGNVSILLCQNGSVVNTIASSLVYNSSPFSWNVDVNSYSTGVNYTIKVVSDNNNSIYDQSPNFEISEELIQTISLNPILNPVEIGQTIDIQWTATNITGNVSILLYQNGSVLNTIGSAPGSVTNFAYSWYIDAASYSAGTIYAIRVVSDNDMSIYGESDLFSIVDPSTFNFFDDFSNPNVKIYPNINNTYVQFGCYVDVETGISGGNSLHGFHVSQGSSFNTAYVLLEDIISYNSATGTQTDPLILEMDFKCELTNGGNYDQYYQSTDLKGGYGLELYDADQNLSFMIYVRSVDAQMQFLIWDWTTGSPVCNTVFSPSHLLNPAPSIYVTSLAGIQSIKLEYDGSSFKLTSSNFAGSLTESANSQYYTNIDFEKIGFLFLLNSTGATVDANTYFDNVQFSGVGVAKKGKKKNASFLRSNNKPSSIPFKK